MKSLTVDIEEVVGEHKMLSNDFNHHLKEGKGFNSVIQCQDMFIATSTTDSGCLYYFDSKTYKLVKTEDKLLKKFGQKISTSTTKPNRFRLLKMNEEIFVVYGRLNAKLYSSTTKSVVDENFCNHRLLSTQSDSRLVKIRSMMKLSEEKVVCFYSFSEGGDRGNAFTISLNKSQSNRSETKRITGIAYCPVSDHGVCLSKKFLDVFYFFHCGRFGKNSISMIDYERNIELRVICFKPIRKFGGFHSHILDKNRYCLETFLAHEENENDEESHSEIIIHSDHYGFSFFKCVDSHDQKSQQIGSLPFPDFEGVLSHFSVYDDQILFCIRQNVFESALVDTKKHQHHTFEIVLLDITSNFNQVGRFTVEHRKKEIKEEVKKKIFEPEIGKFSRRKVNKKFFIPKLKKIKKRQHFDFGIEFLRQDRKVVDFVVFGEKLSKITVLSASNLPLSNVEITEAAEDYKDRYLFIKDDYEVICEEHIDEAGTQRAWIEIKIRGDFSLHTELNIFKSFLIS